MSDKPILSDPLEYGSIQPFDRNEKTPERVSNLCRDCKHAQYDGSCRVSYRASGVIVSECVKYEKPKPLIIQSDMGRLLEGELARLSECPHEYLRVFTPDKII